MFKELYIDDYDFVPEVYRKHIPNPHDGYIKLHYKESNVKVYVEQFSKGKSEYKETITFKQAEFFCNLVNSWNNKYNEKRIIELAELNKLEEKFKSWISSLKSDFIINEHGEVVDKNNNVIFPLCYDHIGKTSEEIKCIIQNL